MYVGTSISLDQNKEQEVSATYLPTAAQIRTL